MVEVPKAIPLTTPVLLTVATVTLLLLQIPPSVGSLRVVVDPSQTLATPDIAPGTVLTVTTVVVRQPEPREYVITAVPADIPVTTPVVTPTVAIALVLVLHVPPVT